jgi:uncharacterized membrane protein SirB2
MLATLQTIHVLAALVSILGFGLRGLWAWRRPGLLTLKPVKIVPHVIDTILLLSAIGLLLAYGGAWVSASAGWLTAKVVLLVIYIGLGLIALKPWFGPGVRAPAFALAVAVFVWIVAIARAHALVPFAS